MTVSRLLINAEEFDWVLAVEPWGEAYEIKRGQPVVIEADVEPVETYNWSVGRPDPTDGSVVVDVMADRRRVVVGRAEIENAFGWGLN